MKENKLIVKHSVLSLLMEVYSTEFSVEDFTKINLKEMDEVMELSLEKINEQIEIKRETSSEEQLNALQEKVDSKIREEMELLILNVFNEIKSEIK